MPMNTVIQARRKALGLTQEQIADYLGVSTPAVNKWERGATCPDISLLAPLARLLRIDLNELLCFHENLSEQELAQFSLALTKAIQQQGLDAAFALAEEKLREYPTCDQLLYCATTILEGAVVTSALPQEEKAPYCETQLRRYEQLAHSADGPIRSSALYMLASKYLQQGDYAKAQEMSDAMPERSALDKQRLQASILAAQGKTDEAAALLERRVLNAANELQLLLIQLSGLEQEAGEVQAARRIADIAGQAAALFDLWSCYFTLAPFVLALKEKDTEKALPLLEKYLESFFTPWEVKDSPLYFRNADKLSTSPNKQLLPALFTALETDPHCEFLRSCEGYHSLLARYR